ncbi:DUF2510 domain-containing protein [Phycicoccus sp. MAQZ13P-2]|uniref:DUF2510 domain-containing protein n=1 Tax=Phycicoccus mangrovi TaxID=2840470 RepID=UPI001C000B7B|nr:DUF2510 domain-containing protein [Phycicoccus mangrovi]MBT9256459.1 DUF2510 domain-containing protein [Phycicoccus mangrovi]MBT9275108.1 DUF2510 domain-containing protein [Phycicoccus mangrovi]
MTGQAPAGWYADGYGNERYWDGAAWTESLRPMQERTTSVTQSEAAGGALAKWSSAVRKVGADKRAAKDDAQRRQAEARDAAGALHTSGVFGSSTIEIYEGGYVRVASWPHGTSGSTPAPITKSTLFERLRSISFTPPPGARPSGGPSPLEGAVSPAIASLIKGGKGLMKASAPGIAAAGIAHLAGADARKAFLTIVTDRQIHNLTNQTGKPLIGSTNRGHVDVAVALEQAGKEVLGDRDLPTSEVAPPPPPQGVTLGVPPAFDSSQPIKGAAASVSDRLRELASLHQDGILSDEEFASAKAKLLDTF